MPTLEDEQAKRKELDTILAELAQISPESLVRSNTLGVELSFEKGLPYFQRTLRLFRDLQNCSLDGASHTALSQLAAAAQAALAQFKQVQSFTITQYPQNAIQMRDQFISQIRDSYDNLYATVTPHIAYSVRKGTDFDALEREARTTVEKVRATQTEQIAAQRALLDESNRIVESMRRAAAEVGVAQHAIYFKQEADEHQKAGIRWLITTVGLACLTLGFAGFAVWYYSTHAVELTPAQAVQLGIAKLAVLSVLYFGILWSNRTFRAHRHNYTVNKHRQNALSTFETFVKAASDDQTKNAVLLYAAQSFFAPQLTGYLGKDAEPQAAPQVLEIFRASLGKDSH